MNEIIKKTSFPFESNTKYIFLVFFSENFSISKDKIPRNFVMFPRVVSGDATSLVLKWNATESQSVIVYVMSVRKGMSDDIIGRKRRVSDILYIHFILLSSHRSFDLRRDSLCSLCNFFNLIVHFLNNHLIQ